MIESLKRRSYHIRKLVYCVGVVLIASCVFCEVALAAESEPKGKLIIDRHSLTIDGWAGGGVQQGNTEGAGIVALGGTIMLRINWLTIGLGAEVGGVFLHAFHEYLRVLTGVTWSLAPWFQIDTLGAFGFHFEQPTSGIDIFQESRIIGGDEFISIPYFGIRLSPTFVLNPDKQVRALLGAIFEVKQDLGKREPHYMVESCGDGGWFDNEYSCSTDEKSYKTGGFHFTVGIRLGVEFGLAG